MESGEGCTHLFKKVLMMILGIINQSVFSARKLFRESVKIICPGTQIARKNFNAFNCVLSTLLEIQERVN